ncbi:uncharacterized protein TNCV_1570111 [Trichonephila clavipes]|uniref:Homologous recombination OB-fold protein OB-fold domain-containing protein n=1 Tax=Trichonephila clavipes TaxID=2585209 RepID=A0A8X6SYL1_TRICX|nr:uncharacterized protein TNCV_1570111 [Trichonephila clavipes]
MTVNFDLEDEDFFNDTFLSISENDLLNHDTSNFKKSSNSSEIKDVQSLPKIAHNASENSSSSNKKSKHIDTNNSVSNVLKDKEEIVALKNKKESECNDASNPNQDTIIDQASKINSRFVPGFTPKAKKRKLPGPAGVFAIYNDQQFPPNDCELSSTKGLDSEIEIQNITNSQFSTDDLLLPSWQNLQADVSSCQNLLSSAKYFSIRRVLHETSKKKLPKHIVVPVLCVLIKKFNCEDSTMVFIDDTGEIPGKADKEVLDLYKSVIKDGTALILKKVTCLCNILLLKKQSIVSIYFEDGSATHVQDLNNMLDKEPLKPMNCECPGTPKEQNTEKSAVFKSSSSLISPKKFHISRDIPCKETNKKVLKQSCVNPLIPKVMNCNNKVNGEFSGTENNNKTVLSLLEAVLDHSNNDSNPLNNFSSGLSKRGNTVQALNVSHVSKNTAISCTSAANQSLFSKMFGRKQNSSDSLQQNQSAASVIGSPYVKASFEEELFNGNDGMDEFDELLCSLDEKSFLEEM